ncbi:DUF1720 domain-containing protein [Schizosaccharomyces japonicus yFS275]|uniref:Actin cytoskeleton-regulatory complex protein PAN1 n=1 Tax=Schizosaccharomyces japonicus (strain yFS275 / FY16936) TaxID=402676 RepID=B6K810_SCHJY|nr:DUF1720 domain-containing protein [Schizosaccharomyces japonicus yFS275]EEB09664.1 DUF1720 domain-containing protein [Schizosaccharomyces japonicus yFS275]
MNGSMYGYGGNGMNQQNMMGSYGMPSTNPASYTGTPGMGYQDPMTGMYGQVPQQQQQQQYQQMPATGAPTYTDASYGMMANNDPFSYSNPGSVMSYDPMNPYGNVGMPVQPSQQQTYGGYDPMQAAGAYGMPGMVQQQPMQPDTSSYMQTQQTGFQQIQPQQTQNAVANPFMSYQQTGMQQNILPQRTGTQYSQMTGGAGVLGGYNPFQSATGGIVSQPTGMAPLKAQKTGQIHSSHAMDTRLSFVSAADQMKFEQLFKSAVNTEESMSGETARAILSRSRLPNDVLANIWRLSDTTRSGRLLFPQFVLAMYLCNLALTRKPLPDPVPEPILNEVNSMVDAISFSLGDGSNQYSLPFTGSASMPNNGAQPMLPQRTGMQPQPAGMPPMLPQRTGMQPMMPQQTGMQPMIAQRTGMQPVMPQQTGVQPMVAQRTGMQPMMPQQTGVQPMMPQRTGMQPMMPQRTGMQPMMPQQTGVQPMVAQRTGMQPMMPQRTGMQPQPVGMPPMLPQRTGMQPMMPQQTGVQPMVAQRTGMQPMMPQRTGMQPMMPQRTGMQPQPAGMPPMLPQRTGMQPMMPQQTGVQPMVAQRTGMQPMMPQRTGMQPQPAGMPPMLPQRTGMQPMMPQQTGVQPMVAQRTGMQPMMPQRTGMQPMMPQRTGMQPMMPQQTGMAPLVAMPTGKPGEWGFVNAPSADLPAINALGQQLMPNAPMNQHLQNFQTNSDIPWAISKHEKKVYDQIFDAWDKDHKGRVSGNAALEIFGQSRLQREELERIWALADNGDKGHLDRDEFAVALHLIYRKLNGYDIPATLPPELIPPSTRNFSDSLNRVKQFIKEDTSRKGAFDISNQSRLRQNSFYQSNDEAPAKDPTLYRFNEDETVGYVSSARRKSGAEASNKPDTVDAEIEAMKEAVRQKKILLEALEVKKLEQGADEKSVTLLRSSIADLKSKLDKLDKSGDRHTAASLQQKYEDLVKRIDELRKSVRNANDNLVDAAVNVVKDAFTREASEKISDVDPRILDASKALKRRILELTGVPIPSSLGEVTSASTVKRCMDSLDDAVTKQERNREAVSGLESNISSLQNEIRELLNKPVMSTAPVTHVKEEAPVFSARNTQSAQVNSTTPTPTPAPAPAPVKEEKHAETVEERSARIKAEAQRRMNERLAALGIKPRRGSAASQTLSPANSSTSLSSSFSRMSVNDKTEERTQSLQKESFASKQPTANQPVMAKQAAPAEQPVPQMQAVAPRAAEPMQPAKLTVPLSSIQRENKLEQNETARAPVYSPAMNAPSIGGIVGNASSDAHLSRSLQPSLGTSAAPRDNVSNVPTASTPSSSAPSGSFSANASNFRREEAPNGVSMTPVPSQFSHQVTPVVQSQKASPQQQSVSQPVVSHPPPSAPPAAPVPLNSVPRSVMPPASGSSQSTIPPSSHSTPSSEGAPAAPPPPPVPSMAPPSLPKVAASNVSQSNSQTMSQPASVPLSVNGPLKSNPFSKNTGPGAPLAPRAMHTYQYTDNDNWSQKSDEEEESDDEVTSRKDAAALASRLFGGMAPIRPMSASVTGGTMSKPPTPQSHPPPPPSMAAPPVPPAAPPAAPVPPPAPSASARNVSPAVDPNTRSALLQQIHTGARLRKTVTNDKSKPIGGRVVGDTADSNAWYGNLS